MALEVSTLSIEVRSTGIAETSKGLKELTATADKISTALNKTSKATQALSSTQVGAISSIDKYLQKLKQKVDTMGKSVEFSSRYEANLRSQKKSEIEAASSLGAQIDLYKQKIISQKRDIELLNTKLQVEKTVKKEEEAMWKQYDKVLQEQAKNEAKLQVQKVKDAEKGLQSINKEIAAQEKLNLTNLEGQRKQQYTQIKAQDKGTLLNLTGQRDLEYKQKLISQKRDMELRDMELKQQKTLKKEEEAMWKQYDKVLQEQAKTEAKLQAQKVKDAEKGLELINKEILAQERLKNAAIEAQRQIQYSQIKSQENGNLLNLTGSRQIEYNRRRAQEQGDMLNMVGERQVQLRKIRAAEARKQEEADFLSSIQLRAASLGKNNEEMARLRATQKGFSQETIQAAAAQGALIDKLNPATKAIKNHNASMSDANGLARGLTGSLGALWLTYGNIGSVAVGAAIGFSLKQMVLVGKDVEATLASIQVKGGETIESVNKIRDAILDLGKGVYGPREVAKAFETLILAGKSAEESLKGVPAALSLATVGGTSIEKSAYTLVQVGTAMGYTADGFDVIADKIAKTAAVSMSSVDSLSEAFKSASSVGKLYKVSLNDVSVELAALSQLGIQGSAAGTSLKNFYKEFSAATPKVKNVLKQIGLTPDDFKTAEGGMIGIVEFVGKLDGALKKMTNPKAAQEALSSLTNERGVKLAVELMDQFNTKTAEGSVNLSKLVESIRDSGGFASIGFAKLAQTTDNQLKSVKNTLESTFVQTFKNIEPQVNSVARALRDAFSSPEFKSGLETLAVSFGNFVVLLVQNLPTIISLGEAFLAFKGLSILAGGISNILPALAGFRVAMMASGGAVAFMTAALGPFAIALGLAAAAWGIWEMTRTDSKAEKGYKNVIDQSNNYIESLQKESDRITQTNQKLDEKLKLSEALLRVEDDIALSNERQKFDKSKQEFQKDIDASLSSIPEKLRPQALALAQQGGQLANLPVYERLKKAVQGYADTTIQAENKINTMMELQSNIRLGRRNQEAAQEARLEEDRKKRASEFKGGALKAPEVGSRAKQNDIYQTELNRLQGEIERSQDELRFRKEQVDYQYRVGTISRIQQLKLLADAEKESSRIQIEEMQKKLAIAAPDSRKALQEQLDNALDKRKRESAQIGITLERDFAEEGIAIERSVTEGKIKELEKLGKYVEATKLKYGSLRDVEVERLNALVTYRDSFNMQDYSSMTEGQFQAIDKAANAARAALKQYEDTKNAAIGSANVKDSNFAYQALFKKTENSLKQLKNSGSTSGGILEQLFPTPEVDNFLNETIPKLKAALDDLKSKADMTGSSEDKLAYEKAAEDFNRLAEAKLSPFQRAVKKTFKDNGDGLEQVFVSTFQRAQDALEEFVRTGKLNFKSFASSIIAELIRIETKALAGQFLGLGKAGSGGGAGGLLGSLQSLLGFRGFDSAGFFGAEDAASAFAVNGSDFASDSFVTALSTGFAKGGLAAPYSARQVNEQGPELLSVGGKDYLMMGSQGGRVSPNNQVTQGSNQSGDIKFTIVNQTTGRIDSVETQVISPTERALIIKEAVAASAAQVNDPNSKFSRNLRNSTNVQRKR